MKDDRASFDSEELLALANLDITHGNVENALFKLKQVLADNKPPNEAYAITARLYAQIGLFDRAKELFKIYLDTNPTAVVENFQLGMAHFDTGDTSKALSIWENVVNQDPINPPALFYRGLAFAQQNNYADARQSLDTLLKSASADNLYFTRAKDLLNAIDAGQLEKSANGKNVSSAFASNAYQVEH